MIRAAGPQDVRFMRDMLVHAYWRASGPRGTDEQPVWRYVRGWGRPGDAGYVALEGPNPVGAAWYRLFTEAEPGFGFVDERTPELTIAVVPSRRGRGFGHELLSALLDRARRDGHEAISLSVDTDNPAVALYERYGFRRVAETDDGLTMVAQLA